MNQSELNPLTATERQVLLALCEYIEDAFLQNKTHTEKVRNEAVKEKLRMKSVHTIRTHKGSIYKKLNLHGVEDMILWYYLKYKAS